MSLTVNTVSKFILMARSDIAGKFVPCELGEFKTVKDAEVFGFQHFRFTNWLVGKETKRTRENGEVEYEYSHMSTVFKPSNYSSED